VVQSHSATALANAIEHNSLFLLPVWKALGKTTSLFRGKTLPKTVAVLVATAAVVWAALFWQWDFNLQGTGRLKPELLNNVFARVPGEVDQVLVGPNAKVTAGQPVIRQRSLTLEKQLEEAIGRYRETDAELRSVERQLVETRQLTDVEESQLAARASELRVRLSSVQAEVDKIEQMQEMLQLTSPIDGIVITWKNQLEQLKNRPVNQGQSLLEIADPTGDWRLEVQMPEKQMRHVGGAWRAAQEQGQPLEVKFFLATNPDEQFTGLVKTIDNAAQAQGEQGNTVKLEVAFAAGELARLRNMLGGDPKVGGEATVKVYCGQQPAGYVLLHDLVDFIQAKLIFPWF
jgi:multidrug efflux pump subunit AcrA (membrane-fusion protein)